MLFHPDPPPGPALARFAACLLTGLTVLGTVAVAAVL